MLWLKSKKSADFILKKPTKICNCVIFFTICKPKLHSHAGLGFQRWNPFIQECILKSLWKRFWCSRWFLFVLLCQEDPAREHPALHGLHDQGQPGHCHPVVWGQQPLQTPARAGDQVPDVPAHRHRAADGAGHGVSGAALGLQWPCLPSPNPKYRGLKQPQCCTKERFFTQRCWMQLCFDLVIFPMGSCLSSCHLSIRFSLFYLLL